MDRYKQDQRISNWLAEFTYFFVLYGLDKGNGFGLKRTVNETSGIAVRLGQE